MIVYGKRIVEYVLFKHSDKIKKIYLARELEKEHFHEFAKLKVKIKRLDSKMAQALARGGNHQGYLLEIDSVAPLDFSIMKDMDFVLVTSGISDVGNLGALFRSAYVLGVDGIVVCGLSRFKPEGTMRASSGAMLDMPFVVVTNALDVANELRFAGFKLYGTSLEGEKLEGENLKQARNGKKALFLGDEGRGLQPRLLEKMDKIFTIEQKREFDSLNVSAAGAILMDRIINGRD